MNQILESPKLLFLLLVVVSLITINPRINGWNEASRMALTQSLVEHHSFIIDESIFVNGGDKVFINGHFYSDKPALPSLLAAIIYAPLHAFGLSLDYGWNLSYYFIILFTIKIFWIASILAFRCALTFAPVKEAKIPLAVFIYAFASLAFAWTSSFNNHSLAASSLMIAFYFYLKGKHKDVKSALLWSGLFFGLAASMDMPTAIFPLGFSLLVAHKWRTATPTRLFLFGVFIPLTIHFGVNYAIGGTILPLQINPEFFIFEGSVWTDSQALSGVSINSPLFTIHYAIISLFGSKGFVWYNPMLFLLVPLAIRNAQREKVFQAETLIILLGSIILMSYYWLFSSNYGGWSYSMRWFVPTLPLLFFYLFDLDYLKDWHWGKPVLWTLAVCSIIIAGIGLINPWSNQNLHAIPIISNLKQLWGILS
ncbi:MAG: hypothetical protein HOB84_05520 [Candidatus Marinimicrobia bacterium]|jgi:hypothetical protein|nr:hypothetical protein [Candidatus Neomarinimicrobiota bacterium]MBT4359569.1 hypothetical protein [Candidatus Neomarinimicrobiota bacterium]MBT4714211.1 hypothetical protein [Candidatus Neomarinimicrobiota bacterium]MBT4945533.1 hypothetical protein [Candidatus Neomarinimicrobiota bacterium]MBT5314183.1 hypothetical protein [Candidatus Neomarinimicrobiota bacterium]